MRGTDSAAPATVTGFRLDKYEVTVGRFRAFKKAWEENYRPAAGAGKHVHVNAGQGLSDGMGGFEVGWDAAWEAQVNVSDVAREGSYTTWTATEGNNENLPVNYVNWFEGAAFCIWDGGFLPSETEWEYVATGGSEERTYPWGEASPGCDHANFVLDGASCSDTSTHSNPVGSLPLGEGLWKHSDLAGNVREWCLDWDAPFMAQCTDCAEQRAGTLRSCRGGANSQDQAPLGAAVRVAVTPTTRAVTTGLRCARVPWGKEVSESIVPGTVLAGKYRVDRVLGTGGMGMVVLAHHLQLDEKVAIKLLLPSPIQSADTVARFAREARAAVRIKSEYVVRVTDVGSLDSGAPYMVMEYLEGEDLAQMLAKGPLPSEQAVEFTLQACEALAESHALGIVHRDIKPANLFCVRRTDGLLAIKLLDFGISTAHSGADLALTNSGVVMGSPQYMAPEQMIAAKNADGRSDIWSLGAALFELLVGEPPFEAETFAALVMQVNMADSAKLSHRLQGLPTGLAQVVLRCLNVDPAFRYPTVSDMARALVPFGPTGRAQVHADRILRIARTSQHPSVFPAEAESAEDSEWALPAGKTLAPFGRTSREGRALGGRSAPIGNLVVGALGLLALGAGWWWLVGSSGPEASREPRREGGAKAATRSLSDSSPSVDRALPGPALPEPAPTEPESKGAGFSPAALSAAKIKKGRPKAKIGQPPEAGAASPVEPVPAKTGAGPEPPPMTRGEKPDLGGRLWLEQISRMLVVVHTSARGVRRGFAVDVRVGSRPFLP
jgi:serine/threonine protein kinase/formylglycine-generating enzyme required for sulfatase activity